MANRENDRSYTMDELLAKMEPQDSVYNKAMLECIAGLVGHAAQLAAQGDEKQLPVFRKMIVEMAEFWGLAETDTPKAFQEMPDLYQGIFDHAVSAARDSGRAPELSEQARADILSGLKLHAYALKSVSERQLSSEYDTLTAQLRAEWEDTPRLPAEDGGHSMRSAITLYLGRCCESAELHLHLPASQDEIDRQLTNLDDYAEDPGKSIEIRDVDCEIVGIRQYLRMADLSREGELEKLNALAGKIEGMNERQKNMLWGALDNESVNGLDDIIRISEHLSDYVILPNINTDADLGRFLVDTGYKDFSKAVRPYLDYRTIGAEYCAEHGGVYNPGGYVRRKSSVEQAAEKRPALITLHLRTKEPNQIRAEPCRLRLPAADEELGRIKFEVGVNRFTEAAVEKIEFGKPWMDKLLPRNCFCVEDANELALCIEELRQRGGELAKYQSVLSVMEPETLTDALLLAIRLDDFERVTENACEYGEQVLRRMGANDEIIGAIEGYMDYEKFGEDFMVEDGVLRTEFGLIRCRSQPSPEEAQGQQMGGIQL